MDSPRELYWVEQTEAQLPAGEEWLNPREVTFLATLRFAKRRADWRLGRWTAKNAVAMFLGLSLKPQLLRKIEIRAAPSGAPEVFFEGVPTEVGISLSHRAGVGACAVGAASVVLGCDLEFVESHGEAFITDYFTAEEQALITAAPLADQDRLVALLWSGKESALKVLRKGLRLDTRSVIVTPQSVSFCEANQWDPLTARFTDGRVFQGWCSHSRRFVRTLLGSAPPQRPVFVSPESRSTQEREKAKANAANRR